MHTHGAIFRTIKVPFRACTKHTYLLHCYTVARKTYNHFRNSTQAAFGTFFYPPHYPPSSNLFHPLTLSEQKLSLKKRLSLVQRFYLLNKKNSKQFLESKNVLSSFSSKNELIISFRKIFAFFNKQNLLTKISNIKMC